MSQPEKPARTSGLSILKNFGFLSFGDVAGNLFTFAFFVVLARTYGQDGIGQYSFAMALTAFISVATDFGLYSLSVRDMSRNPEGWVEYFSRIFMLRIILSAFIIPVLVLVAWFGPFTPELALIIAMIGAYQIALTLVNGYGALFIAREEMHIASMLVISLRAVTAIAGIAAVFAGASLPVAISVLPVATVLHMVAGYILVRRRYGAIRPSFSLPFTKKILHEAVPYAMHVILMQFSTRWALIVAGFLLGAAAAGIFNAAYRIVILIMVASSFAGFAMLPVVSRLYMSSRQELARLCEQALKIMILVAVPTAAGLWLIAPELTILIYGDEFQDTIPILRILACLLLVVVVRELIEVILLASDRQPEVTRGYWWTTGITIPAIAAAAYHSGLPGVTWTVLAVETGLLVYILIRLNALIGVPAVGSRIVISLAGVGAFYLVAGLMPEVSMWITVPVSIVVYCMVLLLFREIRQQELPAILRMYRESRGV